VLSQASYYSHNDVRLHFGLGASRGADRIEVRWPSGIIDTVNDVRGGQVLTIREGAAPATGR
jgi:enediyne biosynthesis protein E4